MNKQEFIRKILENNRDLRTPSVSCTHDLTDRLLALLVHVLCEDPYGEQKMDEEYECLRRLLCHLVDSVREPGTNPEAVTEAFFGQLPEIYTGLIRDAKVFAQNDPAAKSVSEVIICYPGFHAIAVHRLAHLLYAMNVPVLPRVMSEYAHSRTGIDINPGAEIGPGFYIDHGTGVVIGETCVIGKNVKIYQGVTLGAKFVKDGMQGTKRHPTIGDNVIVYAGSTILGGETVIGHDTIVGGNVWLTHSVPPNSRVYYEPETEIRLKG